METSIKITEQDIEHTFSKYSPNYFYITLQIIVTSILCIALLYNLDYFSYSLLDIPNYINTYIKYDD